MRIRQCILQLIDSSHVSQFSIKMNKDSNGASLPIQKYHKGPFYQVFTPQAVTWTLGDATIECELLELLILGGRRHANFVKVP